MPVFNDQENKPPLKLFPDGDYAFTVMSLEQSIVRSGKNAGATQYGLEIMVHGPDATVYEYLTDTPKASYRIDTFLKCCGVKIPKGQAFEFDAEEAVANSAAWVNAVGLRGWARFTKDSYQKDKDSPLKERMKVAVFYTDKQKLAPDEKLRAAAAAPEENEDKPF